MMMVEGRTVVVRVLIGPVINEGDGCMVAAGDGRGMERVLTSKKTVVQRRQPLSSEEVGVEDVET